jgi:type IV secretory pathway VirB10-like protein
MTHQPNPHGGIHFNRALFYIVLALIGALVCGVVFFSSKQATQTVTQQTKTEVVIRQEPLPEDLAKVKATYGDLAARRASQEPRLDADELARLRAEIAQLRDQRGHPNGVASQTTPQAKPRDAEAERRQQEARERAKADAAEVKAARQSPIAVIRHDGKDENSQGLQPLRSPYTLFADTKIPCTLETGLNSETPGPLIARVRQTVYDSLTGEIPLIPQGAAFMGDYRSAIHGEARAQSSWHMLTLPNGDELELKGLVGSDPSGQTGHSGEVDYHWGRFILGSLFSGGLNAGSQAAMSVGAGTSERAAGAMTQSTLQQSQQRLSRGWKAEPTITVPPGSPCTIVLQKSMILRPYRGS